MQDPVDWGLVLESPVFWGALMALLGVLVGHLTSARSKKNEQEFEALQANVGFLQAEYERLSKEVRTLRDEMEKTRKSKRVIAEKYSVALQVIQTGTVWLKGVEPQARDAGVDLSQYPRVPKVLTEDMPLLGFPDGVGDE